MKERPDLCSERSPRDLEVYQLTTEEGVASSHVYMEAQIFTPDSRRFILHRSAHPHGSRRDDPEHRYLVCDLDDHGRLAPITEEPGATGPAVAPDGSALYYFVDQTEIGGGRLLLRRVRLDGSGRETLLAIDSPLPGCGLRPSRPYPLSTIRADGKRLATAVFLGDGRTPDAPWGLLVCDLERGRATLALQGPSWCNLHPQYCRSTHPEQMRDIMVQENHDNQCKPDGTCVRLVGGDGADIHVLRDDGTAWRDLPWGRDGNEFCQGHQCWIGRTGLAITSTATRQPPSARLIAGKPVPHVGHLGARTPGAWRNDLSRSVPAPDFHHFATDAAGRRFISDAGPQQDGGAIWLAELDTDEQAPLANWTFLLNPRSSWTKNAHIHPFLAPDGSAGFFNSDESGTLQAYMVRGW